LASFGFALVAIAAVFLLPSLQAVSGVLRRLAGINAALGLFNLVPGYPLDGGRVLRAAIWQVTGSLPRATYWASHGGQVVGGILMAIGALHLFNSDLFGAVWMGFLGFMLYEAAGSLYTALVTKTVLAHVNVGAVMSAHPVTVTPNATLREVVDRYVQHLSYGGYPVVDGRFEGVLQASAIKQIAPERWGQVHVREIMVTLDETQALHPDEPVGEALERFGQLGVGRLPVIDAAGEVVGILSQTDVVRWITWHPEASSENGLAGVPKRAVP
jgi:CBS domain-containing protein